MFKHDPLADPRPLIERVYSYVAYRVGGGAAAEDITSDVFERALRYRDSYDARKGSPASWLIGIARRCVDDAHRGLETVSEPPDVADDGELEERTIRRLSLGSAIAQLGERERDLLALRYGADMTARQIAEVLDATPAAVEMALSRALTRLRGIVDEGAVEAASPPRRSAVQATD